MKLSQLRKSIWNNLYLCSLKQPLQAAPAVIHLILNCQVLLIYFFVVVDYCIFYCNCCNFISIIGFFLLIYSSYEILGGATLVAVTDRNVDQIIKPKTLEKPHVTITIGDKQQAMMDPLAIGNF